MPSIVDLAHLCEAAYQDGPGTVTVPPPPARSAPDLPGSRLLHDTNAVLQQPRPRVWRKAAFAYNQVGFYCASYTSDTESVLAFRGTDDFWDGLADDLVIAAGGVPPHVLAAFRTVSAWAAPGASYLTGHSLGGALAILSASQFNTCIDAVRAVPEYHQPLNL